MKLFTLISILLASLTVLSQSKHEMGVLLGAANYLGEIGGKEGPRRDFIFDMQLHETNESVGFYHRHEINHGIGFTTSLVYARITGADSYSLNPGRKGRNLEFQNLIFEGSGRLEYYFYNVHDVGGHHRYLVDFKPYLFAGLGFFTNNPTINYNGEKVKLRTIKTEGQVLAYPLISASIPMGMGFFMTYNRKLRLSFEFSYRKTFTDYLDDVSTIYPEEHKLHNDLALELSDRNDEIVGQPGIPEAANYSPGNKRGDPTNDDTFLTANIGIGLILDGNNKGTVVTRGPFSPKFKIRTKF